MDIGIKMRELTDIKEIQKIEMDILKYIKCVCESNGLRYYLAFGTLLGAIRHNGFIPWDDDVDIFMPYEDYIKFVDVCIKNPSERYKLISYETDDCFTAPLPKVIDTKTKVVQHYGFIEKVELGLYVDIFPLSGLGDECDKANNTLQRAQRILDNWALSDTEIFPPNRNKLKSLISYFIHTPIRIKGYRYYINQQNMVMKENSFDNSAYVTRFGLPFDKKIDYLWEKHFFDEGIEVLFEGEIFRAPKEYDVLLKKVYGNYMSMPPEEKRISHHHAEMYALE